MKIIAAGALALFATAAESAQPLQSADRTVTADQAAYGSVTVSDTVPCPRGQPGFTSSYTFPIRFQAPFANDRYAVLIGQSGQLAQPGQAITYSSAVTDRAREGMTITVNIRCQPGSRTLTLDYIAVGRR